ncbi:MAG: hypothetical protein JNL58_17835 [Planctomyces sp.]|nr:hypothetical protein [Planctomyces sp.]
MESSRGGMLSTLIMTIPLIVVPAIALLRPPAPNGTSVTGSVEAGTEMDDFGLGELDDDFEEEVGSSDADSPDNSDRGSKKPRGSRSRNEFDDLFPEETSEQSEFGRSVDPTSPGETGALPETRLADSGSKAIGSDASVQVDESPPEFSPNDINVESTKPSPEDSFAASELIVELNSLGVRKTLWFSPGTNELHGFAAFLNVADQEFLVRFEAIGNTRADAVRDVLQQVRAWKTNGGASGP